MQKLEKTKGKEEENKESVKKESPKENRDRRRWEEPLDISGWEPKTKLGREVKDGKVKNINEILENKRKIDSISPSFYLIYSNKHDSSCK